MWGVGGGKEELVGVAWLANLVGHRGLGTVDSFCPFFGVRRRRARGDFSIFI
jgi:hypothetical protein